LIISIKKTFDTPLNSVHILSHRGNQARTKKMTVYFLTGLASKKKNLKELFLETNDACTADTVEDVWSGMGYKVLRREVKNG
tara:strand:+ start:5314 stop:5559 length:246 start_codon:yes stop_codon:yes gene_type:complete